MNATPPLFLDARVVARELIDDASGLCHLQLDVRPQVEWAGQYVRVRTSAEGSAEVDRFISLASPPGAPASLLLSPSPNDEPGDPASLQVGDRLRVSGEAAGQLCLRDVPAAETLWLLAGGTGLAPMAAIFAAGVPRRFERVVLVHAARTAARLAFRGEFEASARAGALRYVPIVSRDDAFAGLRGRIPARIADGSLAGAAGAAFGADAVALICGPVAMVADVKAALAARAMPLDAAARVVVTEF
jgi:ferredoxin--NADP+ reductase